MISVTKIFEFCAAHYLPNHEGLCKNMHGHTYKLEVEIQGSRMAVGPEKGMVMDFSNMKEIVNELIIDRYDHALLNDYWQNPTAEIMVEDMAVALKRKFRAWPPQTDLLRLRLWETPTSYAEWRRDG